MLENMLAIAREHWQIIAIVIAVLVGGCWQMFQNGGSTELVQASATAGNVAETSSDVAVTPVASKMININTASSSELQKIPGVGPAKAKLIIEYRQGKRFDSIDELLNISGIGPKTFEKLREHVIVE